MSNFPQIAKNHLAAYKTSTLGISEDGIWRGNDRTYPHILPKQSEQLNVLATIRDKFWSYHKERANIKLHDDFHHLNSSQALAFNLFYPMLQRPELFLSVAGISALASSPGHFEVVLDTTERTNFDFVYNLASGGHLLFEVKYTEDGFGPGEDSPNQRKRLADIYLPRLTGLVDGSLLSPERVFFDNYQLLRNVSYLAVNPANILFLVFPDANAKVKAQAIHLLAHVPDATKQRITLVYLDELVDKLMCCTALSADEREHYRLFSEKYSPGSLRKLQPMSASAEIV